MLAPLPNSRYERKFIAEGLTLGEALALVRRNPAAFREVYPCRVVNNIYLDSPGLSAYYDHIHGAPERVKHRVRWYGHWQGDISKPVLERKLKRGSVSGKASFVLPPVQVNSHPLGATLERAFADETLPKPLHAHLRHLQPCLLNRYRRHYFLSGDGRFRLTVDSELQFGSVAGAQPQPPACHSARPLIVLEVKFDLPHAAQAVPITNALPFRLARCSKYVLGMEAL